MSNSNSSAAIKQNELLAANLMNEAVAFKKWCDNGRAWFWDNNEQHTHTDEELYKLFKMEQSQGCG